MTLKKKTFEKIVGKGENASNQHFLLFLQSFLPVPKHISIIQSYLFCRLQNAFNLDQYENLVKEVDLAICRQKLDDVQMLGFVFYYVENIVGKEENAGYQHFLLFLQWFLQASEDNWTLLK